ncbi:MAG: hypothetical protein JWQ87_944 [Candidatus Sulfotelmatobacter sp.]|nr:hypothetical protein [Candidatus Sulfotelmatobacter sp.]
MLRTYLLVLLIFGVSGPLLASTFTYQIEDLETLQSFTVSETMPDLLNIKITNGVFAVQGDVRLYEDEALTQLEDLIRFVNVDGEANIFYATQVNGNLNPAGVPALTTPDFINPFQYQIGTELSGTIPFIGPTCAAGRCMPNCKDEVGALFSVFTLQSTPIPEPSTLALTFGALLTTLGLCKSHLHIH